MKKNISIKGLVLLLALCLVGSFAMYGCGSDDKSSSKADSSASDIADKSSDDSKNSDENSDDDTQVADITGEWVLDQIVDADGNSQTLEEYCAAKGVDSSGVDVTYTFSEDGTLVGAVGGVGVDVHLVMSGFLTFPQGLFLVQLGHDTVKRGGRNLRVGEH